MNRWLVLAFNQNDGCWNVVGEHRTEQEARRDVIESDAEIGGDWTYCTYAEAYRRFRVAREEYDVRQLLSS